MPLQRQESASGNIGQLRADSAQDHAQVKTHGETLAGSAINTVWDTIAGDAHSPQAKAERARSSDEYAEIAADTFSAVPKFRAIVGGMARGILLADVSGKKGVGEWSKDFALNVAEGAFLNKASKLGGSESALTKFAGKTFGGGIASELAVHGTSGAAFGAVKAGFNFDSALDKSGNFSSAQYLENIGLSTVTGGIIGMPAGAFGSRVGKIVSSSLSGSAESSLIAHTVRNTLTAGSSGFAGGAVFGGVESLKQSHNVSDILAASLKGGAIGFITGGATGAFEPRLTHAIVPERPFASDSHADQRRFDGEEFHHDRQRTNGRRRFTDATEQEAVVQPHTDLPQFDFEALAFKPVEVRVRDYENQISLEKTETRTDRRVNDDLPANHKALVEKFAKLKKDSDYDFSEFYLSMTSPEVREYNVYKIEGLPMKILVPKDYADQLHEVRMLRHAHEVQTPYDELPMGVRVAVSPGLQAGDATVLNPYLSKEDIAKSIPVIQSGLALMNHPLASRALPEDLIPILRALPNPGLIKEIILSDKRDYSDVFSQVKYNDPNFRAAADVTPLGIVRHYQGTRRNVLSNTYHEWAHLTKWATPEIGKIYDMATIVDKVAPNFDHKATRLARVGDPSHPGVVVDGIFFPHEHASRNADENWAVAKGELFMNPDPDGLYIFANEAPVRALALSTALETTLNLRHGVQTDQDLALRERIRYVDEVSRPLAIEALTNHLQSGSVEQKSAAAKLLGLYGDATAIGALRKAAMDTENNVKPDWNSFEGVISPVRDNPKARGETPQAIAVTALNSMITLGGDSHTSRMRFALQEAMDNPQLRPLIAENWMQFAGKFPEYQPFVEMYDKPGYLNRMQKHIELRLQGDPFGRKMAFDEVMRLTEGDSRAQTGFLLRNYTHVGGLRFEVVQRFESLMKAGQLRSIDRKQAQDFFTSLPRKEMAPLLQQRVDDLLTHMQKEQQVESALEALNKSGRQRLESIHDLALMRDVRGIKPLLEQAVSGNSEVQNEALKALGQFSPNMVKFYAQELRRASANNAVKVKRIEQLMSGRSHLPG